MNKFILMFFILTAINQLIFTEKIKDEPSWVYLKRAENLKERGEYSQAVVEARRAREVYVKEQVDKFFDEIREKSAEKTDYEIKKIVESKREELMQKDNFPEYHELLGDLFVLTNFLSEAEKEYNKAAEQKQFFEYKEKANEISYKLSGVYEKGQNYEAADIIYREMAKDFMSRKDSGFWSRLKDYIKQDSTLSRIFRIYRDDGIEYFKALYKIGKRSSLLGRPDDALFYLANAAVVYMTYKAGKIRETNYQFQYAGPVDFIKFAGKKEYSTIGGNDYFDEVLFFIGYANRQKGNNKISGYFFDLALRMSKGTARESEIKNRIEYLGISRDNVLTNDEFLE
jgi:tetratricopeptide (TPR) repeat protein